MTRVPPAAPDDLMVPKETTVRIFEVDKRWFEQVYLHKGETWAKMFARIREQVEADLREQVEVNQQLGQFQ